MTGSGPLSGGSTRQREQDRGCRGRSRGQESRGGAQQEGWGCAVRSGGGRGQGGCDPLPEVIQMTWMIILRAERILNICSQPEALSFLSSPFNIYRAAKI